METALVTFAERLKQLREKAGMTQAVLAKAAGMHTMGISSLERGVHEPSWPTVKALAKALGVSVAAFVEEEE